MKLLLVSLATALLATVACGADEHAPAAEQTESAPSPRQTPGELQSPTPSACDAQHFTALPTPEHPPQVPTPTPDPRPTASTSNDSAYLVSRSEFVFRGHLESFAGSVLFNPHFPDLPANLIEIAWIVAVDETITGDPGENSVLVNRQFSYDSSHSREGGLADNERTVMQGESAVFAVYEVESPHRWTKTSEHVFGLSFVFPVIDGMVCTGRKGQINPEPVDSFIERIKSAARQP